MRKRNEKAFTLLELLVAIGILAVLATLTTAGISSAGAKAKQIQCVANLHQYGVALHSFVADRSVYPLVINPGWNLGVEPEHSSTVFGTLAKYGLGPVSEISPSVHVCPAAPQKLGNNPGSRNLSMYAYNATGLGRRTLPEPMGLGGMAKLGENLVSPVAESTVENPSALIAFGDGARGWEKTYEDGVGFFARTPDSKDYVGSTQRVAARHRGSLVTLFADGHATPMKLPRLFEDRSDPALAIWNRDALPHRERLE